MSKECYIITVRLEQEYVNHFDAYMLNVTEESQLTNANYGINLFYSISDAQICNTVNTIMLIQMQHC